MPLSLEEKLVFFPVSWGKAGLPPCLFQKRWFAPLSLKKKAPSPVLWKYSHSHTCSITHMHKQADIGDDDEVELNVLGCRVDILGTNYDQWVNMVQCCFTSAETIGSLGRGAQDGHLDSHSSWTVTQMMSWCLMSSDVSWHIRDKLWPMPKHGSINLHVHRNQKAR